jgi:NTP pyrophosphatase (non-canonical NTP hydrolase)
MSDFACAPTLTLLDYQRESQKTAIYPEIGGPEVYPALGLASEAGEVLGKIKKVYRDKAGAYDADTLAAIADELGDVLWYLSQLATKLGLSMDMIATYNLMKLKSRQARNTLTGNGDQR